MKPFSRLFEHNDNWKSPGLTLFTSMREEAMGIATGTYISTLYMLLQYTCHQQLVAVRCL
jgi:hypothetical protein